MIQHHHPVFAVIDVVVASDEVVVAAAAGDVMDAVALQVAVEEAESTAEESNSSRPLIYLHNNDVH